MRVLCTNDDGVHAEGLAVLERIAAHFSEEVWVVAPEYEQSGASRALTLTAPVRVREAGPRRFAVSGTPTDCVLLAVQQLMPEPPDLVLSGVNRGQNLAEDVTFSGTIAGAMQGMQLGVPAVAMSQTRGLRVPGSLHWATAERYGPGVLDKLLDMKWPADVVMNVNFPDVPPDEVAGVEVTVQGRRDQQIVYADKRTDLRGEHYYWLGYQSRLSDPPEGTDLRAIYEGRISVTPLHVDLTHAETRALMKRGLGGAAPKLRACT
jgi:5'-nucleotidase